MKSFVKIIILLFAHTTLVSGAAWAGRGIESAPSSAHRLASHELIVAQIVGVEDKEGSYQEALDLMLGRDDFVAAEDYVDALAGDADVTPATLRSLNSQIRRVRTARILDYAEKIRAAITTSDFDAVRDYSERMERLRSAARVSDPASVDKAEKGDPMVDRDRGLPAETGQSSPDTRASTASQPSSIAKDAILVRRMQTALDEDRLFSPTADNAFDLATARLSTAPDDLEARGILDDVIERQQSQVLSNLEDRKPQIALDLTKQLLEAVGSLQTEEAMPTLRSSAERWVEQTRPTIIAGLVTNTEQAIERYDLTIAPNGQLSAEGYVSLLATELGRDHNDVKRLARNIVDKYQGLINRRLAERRYDKASAFHARMEATARRFGLSTDQAAALGSEIQASRARQEQHDQLLLKAAEWRDKGQLIEPVGANALEFAGKAVGLGVNAAAADKVLKEVIIAQREKIDRLIVDGRLEQAAGQLQQLASAIEPIDTKRSDQAAAYYAEAEQILQRADLEDSQRQQQIEEAKQDGTTAVAPVEPAQTEKPPFTFINPF